MPIIDLEILKGAEPTHLNDFTSNANVMKNYLNILPTSNFNPSSEIKSKSKTKRQKLHNLSIRNTAIQFKSLEPNQLHEKGSVGNKLKVSKSPELDNSASILSAPPIFPNLKVNQFSP